MLDIVAEVEKQYVAITPPDSPEPPPNMVSTMNNGNEKAISIGLMGLVWVANKLKVVHLRPGHNQETARNY